MAATLPDLRPVDVTPRVPGYSSLAPLGVGGSSTVYRAVQDSVGRPVALKVMHPSRTDDCIHAQFERECQAVGRLSWHPHIVSLLDAGSEADGRHHLAFELIGGGSLADLVDQYGPIAWDRAIAIGVQIADALAAAHAAGICHGDIKPANILLDDLGRAKLADFGIAQTRNERDRSRPSTDQPSTDQFAVSLAHAAPEFLLEGVASERTDVYMLASTLYELIAGTPPFGRRVDGGFWAMVHRVTTSPAPGLDHIDDCPPALGELLEACLSKNPNDRPATAHALGSALRELQERAGLAKTPMPFVDTQRPPAIDRVGRGRFSARSLRQVAMVIMLVAGLFVAGASGTLMDADATSSHAPTNASDLLRPATVAASGFASGMPAANAIDGDLSTGWMTSERPHHHMLMVDFGQSVNLDSVVVYAGSDAIATGRGLGMASFTLSDGSVLDVPLDPDVSVQEAMVGRTTTSLTITVADGDPRPVVIRDLQFVGSPTI